MFLIGLLPIIVFADASYRKVQVAAPYIELHTGPAVAYPIDYVVERGDWVSILKRRTDWFLVRSVKDKEGWVHLSQMRQTLEEDGEPLAIESLSEDSFRERTWEMGFQGGEMDGTALLNLYGGFSFNPGLSVELGLSQAIGDYSSEYMVDLNLLAQPFPESRFSPFFTLGTGIIHTDPNATLVQTEDRTDTTAHTGLGMRIYLTRRFYLRGEYRYYKVFTSRNENEEFDQWKIGLGVFF